MKIPDFLLEGKKETENPNPKSDSEQNINEIWGNQPKSQPFLKDFLLQEW